MKIDESAVLTARNKFKALHLAILGLAETTPDREDEILSIERVFDEALADLDRGLKLDVTEAA
jgi:hypothetical protein